MLRPDMNRERTREEVRYIISHQKYNTDSLLDPIGTLQLPYC
jgi:hypothetical protein